MKNEIEILDKLVRLKQEKEAITEAFDKSEKNLRLSDSLLILNAQIDMLEWILEDEFFGVDI